MVSAFEDYSYVSTIDKKYIEEYNNPHRASSLKFFSGFTGGGHSAGVDGVGIGLCLTRDILKKQDGYIKVAADENGSAFSIFLRREDSQGT